MAAYLTAWLGGLNLEPGTVYAYSRWCRHAIEAVGHVKLDKLTPQHVDAMLAAKARSGLSPQSVSHIRAVLRTALSRAVKWGLVGRNVAALANPPRVKQYNAVFLRPTQAAAFLKAACGNRLEAMYTCAIALGLRQSEALGLMWDDIDFAAHCLHVRHALKRVTGRGLVIGEPKWGSSRVVVLPEIVLRQLQAHARRQKEERLAAGPAWQDRGLVFTTMEGRPLSASHVIADSFRPLIRAASIPGRVRFHDLRHSAATLLLAQGVSARVVADLLGHSRVNITLDRYSHIVQELRDDAAKAMDRALGTA